MKSGSPWVPSFGIGLWPLQAGGHRDRVTFCLTQSTSGLWCRSHEWPIITVWRPRLAMVPGLLCVLAKPEEHFYLLCDGPVLIQGPIYIVNRDWLGQRGCFQVVFPDEMAPDEHPGGP